MKTQEFLDRLATHSGHQPKRNGNGWMANCPGPIHQHGDRNPSLSVTEAPDRILINCMTGDAPEQVVAALGLDMADLFFNKSKHHLDQKPRISETYPYHDEAGKALFEVVRYEPKDFRQRQPDPSKPSGWTWSTAGVNKPLFRLPEVLKAKDAGHPILVCEGEKDAMALVKAGFTATCNPGGADNGTGGKWLPQHTDTLAGAHCVIIPDKDPAGWRHAAYVAGQLHGTAASVKVVELPGATVKDAFDFFAAGGKAEDIISLIDAAPLWTPGTASEPPTDTTDAPPDNDGQREREALPLIESAASLLSDSALTTPQEVIIGLLHLTCKMILGSGSKARKTWCLIDLALSVAAGVAWWIFKTTQGRVLYINFEIPRAFIRSRIQAVQKAKGISDDALQNLDVWTLRGHAAALWKLLPGLMEQIGSGNYSLIIIDPVYKGLGGRDENAAGDIAELCNELERLAVQSGAAVVFAAHYSKGNQASKEAMDRIGGSGVFARDADTICTLTKHQAEDCYTVDLILRNFPEQPPFVLRWNYPLMEVSDLNPDDLRQAGGRKPKYSPDDTLQVLKDAGELTTTQWRDACREEHGTGERTFYDHRRELERAKRVIKSKVTDKWTALKK